MVVTDLSRARRQRVMRAYVASVVELCNCEPSIYELAPRQEWCAALGYQLNLFPLPPHGDVEVTLASRGLLIRPHTMSAEDARIEFEADDSGDETT